MNNQVSPDKISRAVRAYFLAVRAMDADAFANTFAEDGTTFDPVGSPAITGREALRSCKGSTYAEQYDFRKGAPLVAGSAGALGRPRRRREKGSRV